MSPVVGKKKFPYTKKGENAAEQYAEQTGKQLKVAKGKKPMPPQFMRKK